MHGEKPYVDTILIQQDLNLWQIVNKYPANNNTLMTIYNIYSLSHI